MRTRNLAIAHELVDTATE